MNSKPEINDKTCGPKSVASSKQRLALAVAAIVFIAWTAWLAYEAVTTAKVIVVSRPQILIAPIVVEAEVPDGQNPERKVTVRGVYKSNDPALKPDANLTVSDLGRARGWQGSGAYILALRREGETYQLVPTPPSPGFRPVPGSELAAPPLYPATESTRMQVRAILGHN